MTEKIDYALQVNGESWPVQACAEATLLDVLRTELALTGCKRGCNQGVCGACTVLLDDRPVRACLTLAANIGTRAVMTIEGLAPLDQLGRVQRAMLETGAVQCGFCTPGMVLAIEGALRATPNASESELRDAISGNLCRCSGYVKIMEAAIRAASHPA